MMNKCSLDPWFVRNLVCPIDHSCLHVDGSSLVSEGGRAYPVVDGIPVMLRDDREYTIGVAANSLRRARGEEGIADQRAPELYLESLGISDSQREAVAQLARRKDLAIDPVVAYIIGATNGIAYRHLIGRLDAYPIPDIRLPRGEDRPFLDLGCNWGRWCVAAARKGYTTVGIDPQLGAVMAARRVARQLNLPNRYLVAYARFLPFKSNAFEVVFSYSVLQHLAKDNVRTVLCDVARVLAPGGRSLIQMPNLTGIRSLQHVAQRHFREPRDFEVRYWTLPELQSTFNGTIGPSSLTVDCYFGLGLQKSDVPLMTPLAKTATTVSEVLRSVSNRLGLLKYAADSVYVSSTRIA